MFGSVPVLVLAFVCVNAHEDSAASTVDAGRHDCYDKNGRPQVNINNNFLKNLL